jgi:hypothetical protein
MIVEIRDMIMTKRINNYFCRKVINFLKNFNTLRWKCASRYICLNVYLFTSSPRRMQQNFQIARLLIYLWHDLLVNPIYKQY